MDIKNYIPVGHENAVTVETLMAMTGLSNRQVRESIAESDAIILNVQDGKGYFQMDTTTKAERAYAQKYSAQEKARGWSVLRKAFRIDRRVNEIANRGQVYRFARMLAGYTVDEVARELDVSHYYVTSVEDGYFEPTEKFKKGFEKLVGLEI
mgnify:CR=1 FL=1